MMLTGCNIVCAAATAPRMAVFPGSYSDAVPFLKQPTNLDGSLPGDVGFDPLGFSEVFDVKVLREAELKHGRIAMLAVLGWIVQETAPASIHPGFPTVSCLTKDNTYHIQRLTISLHNLVSKCKHY